jgi:hypothetical protein
LHPNRHREVDPVIAAAPDGSDRVWPLCACCAARAERDPEFRESLLPKFQQYWAQFERWMEDRHDLDDYLRVHPGLRAEWREGRLRLIPSVN